MQRPDFPGGTRFSRRLIACLSTLFIVTPVVVRNVLGSSNVVIVDLHQSGQCRVLPERTPYACLQHAAQIIGRSVNDDTIICNE